MHADTVWSCRNVEVGEDLTSVTVVVTLAQHYIHLYCLTHFSSPQKADLGAQDTLKAALVASAAALLAL